MRAVKSQGGGAVARWRISVRVSGRRWAAARGSGAGPARGEPESCGSDYRKQLSSAFDLEDWTLLARLLQVAVDRQYSESITRVVPLCGTTTVADG